MKALTLQACERKEIKTSRVKKLRKQGLVPGIVYGPDRAPLPIKISRMKLESTLAFVTETTPVLLDILNEEGTSKEKIQTFIKSVQRHKVTDMVIHVDFYAPSETHKMHIDIPLKFVGKPKGVEKGGVEEIFHHEIPCELYPRNLVDYIEVNISNIDLNESLHVKDVKFPEGIKPLLHDDDVILTVIAPRGLEVVEEAPVEEEEVEPEVVGKGKEEEEEEE